MLRNHRCETSALRGVPVSPQLSSAPNYIVLIGHMSMNNLPRVITQACPDWKSNLQPLDRKSDDLHRANMLYLYHYEIVRLQAVQLAWCVCASAPRNNLKTEYFFGLDIQHAGSTWHFLQDQTSGNRTKLEVTWRKCSLKTLQQCWNYRHLCSVF